MTVQPSIQIIEFKASDGKPVKAGQVLVVHYLVALSFSALEKGQWLENSFDKEPILFILGKGEVLKGIDQGLEGMRVGSTRRIIIPPELAFGKKGVQDKVPPDATLAFEIYLVTAD